MKAFIIYLPAREHSVAHATQMRDQLTHWGIDTTLFAGVPGDEAVRLAARAGKTLYPYSIKNRELTATDLKKYIVPELYEEFINKHHWKIAERQYNQPDDHGKLSRPGVIGCFYSHYYLWEKCVELNEPILIFEDDVKLYRAYVPIEFEDVLVVSLGKSSFMRDPQKMYLENPQGWPAAMPWRNFSMPGASGYVIKPGAARRLVKFWHPYWYPADNAINQSICQIQLHSYLMGRNTLPEEGNISMTKSKDWQCE